MVGWENEAVILGASLYHQTWIRVQDPLNFSHVHNITSLTNFMPTALIPYALAAKRGLSYYSAASRYARAAKRARYVGAYGIKYAPAAMSAARKIGRAYRRYKRRKGRSAAVVARRNFGQIPRTSNCKSANVTNDGGTANYGTRTLHATPLLIIERGDELNKRERDIINLRGIKMCIEFNHEDVVAQPLYLNIAVVKSKTRQLNNTSQQNYTSLSDFFRATGGDTRSQDFEAATNLEMHCSPINTDEFHVFMHKRLRLGVNGGGYDNERAKGYLVFDKYLSLKKQIRFQAAATINPNEQLHLVWWCSQMFSSTATPTANAITARRKTMVYFRETKH